MYLTYSRGLIRDSGSSMVWVRRVRLSVTSCASPQLLTNCAADALFYDVYTHVSELHLEDIGIDVQWSDVDVFEGETDRWGKTREYFAMRTYRLPVGKMKAF